jgi:sphingolipid delta-4 desaturase
MGHFAGSAAEVTWVQDVKEDEPGPKEPPAPVSRRDRDFLLRDEDDPHATRKVEILKKHPEIKRLMGFEWRTKYIVLATVALQVAMARLTLHWRWPLFLVAVYVVGATATHSLFLAIHELSHNLGARTSEANKFIAMLANLPIFVPYCMTFKPYHMEHHRHQGLEEVDTDLPTWLEGLLITRTATSYADHTLRKAVFMFCQIFFYAFRPCLVRPDLTTFDSWVASSWLLQLSFDALMIAWLGPQVAWYFLLSLFFAGSIHPTAGHFIAEHYVMEGKAETYSYYGPLNRLAYNVGYHNEHHDFPNIPWSRLPKVREMAPEFYDHLPQCKSWTGVIVRYIFDDSISPYSRMKKLKATRQTRRA